MRSLNAVGEPAWAGAEAEVPTSFESEARLAGGGRGREDDDTSAIRCFDGGGTLAMAGRLAVRNDELTSGTLCA